jgi:hypothetical protein
MAVGAPARPGARRSITGCRLTVTVTAVGVPKWRIGAGIAFA